MKYFSMIAIIAALLGAAYYLDQKEKVVDLSPNREKGEKIFKIELDDLREIHLPNTKLKNNKGEWLVTDLLYPVDKKVLGELINRLNNIHVLKEINVSDKVIDDFFKYQNHYIKLLSFEDKIEVRLGDVSQVTGHFYMQIYKNRKQGLYLCHDTTFFQGFYRTEEEANMQRYLGFKNLVLLKPTDLIERKIFKKIELDRLTEVSFESNSLESFSLNLLENTSKPNTPKNIQKMNFKKAIAFHKDSLLFDDFMELKNQVLDKKISSVQFKLDDGSLIEYELFGELDKKAGYYVSRSNDPMIYTFNPKTIGFFISQLSDFWIKRLDLPKTEFTGDDTFMLSLSANDKAWYEFEVYDLKEFKVRSKSKDVKASLEIQNYDQLFSIIFGQNNYKFATKLEVLKDKDLKSFITKSGTYIKIFGRKLYVNKLNNIVYLLDLDKKLVFTYVKGITDDISFSPNQFFQLVSK